MQKTASTIALDWFKEVVWPDLPSSLRAEIISDLKRVPVMVVFRQRFNMWHKDGRKMLSALIALRDQVQAEDTSQSPYRMVCINCWRDVFYTNDRDREGNSSPCCQADCCSCQLCLDTADAHHLGITAEV